MAPDVREVAESRGGGEGGGGGLAWHRPLEQSQQPGKVLEVAGPVFWLRSRGEGEVDARAVNCGWRNTGTCLGKLTAEGKCIAPRKVRP